jgi:hypothetical protein
MRPSFVLKPSFLQLHAPFIHPDLLLLGPYLSEPGDECQTTFWLMSFFGKILQLQNVTKSSAWLHGITLDTENLDH